MAGKTQTTALATSKGNATLDLKSRLNTKRQVTHEKKPRRGLEKLVAGFASIAVVGTVGYLIANITGAAISLSPAAINVVWAMIFVIGITLAYASIKKKRKIQ